MIVGSAQEFFGLFAAAVYREIDCSAWEFSWVNVHTIIMVFFRRLRPGMGLGVCRFDLAYL